MRRINVIIFIFTDEASETTGDASSSTMSTGTKYRSWAAQVENEEQQEADYSADNLSQPNSLPIDAAERGRRGRRRRNNLRLLFTHNCVLANNISALFL
jgi:hypothetical protein